MPVVPNFLPSQNGLPFINSWPNEPDIVIKVPPFGEIPIGNASNGLCGGMAFTVRDFFEAGLSPPPGPEPAQGTPLFDYIVRRLIDSYNVPGGVLKYFEWMNTPDHDTPVWFVTRRGVAWKTINEGWPGVKADIDDGHPSPLGVVTVQSMNPQDLGKNHQVLAYGYDEDGASNLTVRLYDPNTDSASADGVFLSLNL